MGGIGSAISSVAKPILDDVGAKTLPLMEGVKNYFAKSGWSVLKDMGESGTMLADTLKGADTDKAIMSGGHASDLSSIWDSVKLPDRLAIGQNPASANTIAPQAWQAAQKKMLDVATEAGARGAKVVTNVAGQTQRVPIYMPPDFMPKVLNRDVFKLGTLRNELIDTMVPQMQNQTRTEAEDFVNKLQGQMFGRRGIEIMHDLGGMQVPSKFLENDPKVAMSAWMDSASNYITKADSFGPANQNLKTLINAIEAETGSLNSKHFAMDAVDAHEYGYGNVGRKFYEGVTPGEQFLRNFEGLTKLSTIFLPHSTQSLNTLLYTDAKSLAKGVADIYSDKDAAIKFSLESGATLVNSLRDFKDVVHGRENWTSNILHYTGFDWERKMNLVLAANAGKNYAQGLADDLLQGKNLKEANFMLRDLGIEPSAVIRQGGLVKEDLYRAAYKVAEKTQFIRNPLDMPIYWNKNPAMRTMALYKNYIYSQTKFIKDTVFTNADGKLPQKIAYMSVLYPVFGELVGDMESLLHGEDPRSRQDRALTSKVGIDNPLVARYTDNLSKVGGVGMFFSMLSSLNRGNVTGWLGGPVAGDMEDFARSGWKLATKGDVKPLGKTLAGRVPIVGGILKSEMGEK